MTTPTEDTLARVRKIVAAQAPEDVTESNDQPLFYDAGKERHNDATARGEAGLDSLDQVEIIMGIEEEFDLVVPEIDVSDSADRWNTIAGIADYVQSRIDQEA